MTATAVTAIGSPLVASAADEDSALQAAMRRGPRVGEDWAVQSLLEVCLQRIEKAGCRAAVSKQDSRSNRLLVVTDPTGHRLAAAVMYGRSSNRWDSLRRINATRARYGLLDDVADNLAVKPHYIQTLAALFAEPYDDTWLLHERLNTALGLWWDARLSEGHSVASAQTMLALLVHPSVAAHLTNRRADGCPRLHCP